jgi:hypothetical protein
MYVVCVYENDIRKALNMYKYYMAIKNKFKKP